MTNRTSAEFDSLTLDSSGGAALFGPCGNQDHGRRLVLNEPDLRALDLHDDPLLEVLDLRGCGSQRHLHLQLDRLPQLRELHLPTLTAGAVIYLFQLGLPRTLRIEGAVCEIDANWQQGSLRLVHPSDAWQGVRLLGHDATRADLETRTDPHPEGLINGLTASLDQAVPLSILFSTDTLPKSLTLTASGDWLLADASRLERLILDGPLNMTLQRAHALRQLQVRRARCVRGAGLNQLSVIDAGPGQHRRASDDPCPVQLDAAPKLYLQGRMTGLQIADAWSLVQLRAPKLESLQIAWAKQLSLLPCKLPEAIDLPNDLEILCQGASPTPLMEVASIHMNENVNEARLQQVLRRFEAGEHDLLPELLKLLSQGGTPSTLLHHLTTLLRLAELGFDPVALWDCRRTLYAWHLARRRCPEYLILTKNDLLPADKRWWWMLPHDRDIELAEQADLQLWAFCVNDSVSAREYEYTLDWYMHIEGLLQFWYDHVVLDLAARPQAPKALTDLLLKILAKRQANNEWDCGGIGTFDKYKLANGASYLSRLLLSNTLNQTDSLVVLTACLHWTNWSDLPELVPCLLAVYPGPTRALLMQWVQQDNDWFEDRLETWVYNDWVPDRTPDWLPITDTEDWSIAQIQAARQYLTGLALMPSLSAQVTTA